MTEPVLSAPRRASLPAGLAVAMLLSVGGLTPLAAQGGSFCPWGSICEATFDETVYRVIGPCDMSSVSTVGACLVIGIGPVIGNPDDGPLIVCDANGCGPNSVVQQGSGAMRQLEVEARREVAALRGIPDDNLHAFWSRHHIRAYMYLRLLGLAYADAASLEEWEQLLVEQFTSIINAERVAVAESALTLYHTWAANPCGFQVPVGDPNAYLSQPDVAGSITAPCRLPPNSPACLLGGCTPAPPSAEQFTAWAVGQVLQARLLNWASALQARGGLTLTDEEAQNTVAHEYQAAFGGLHDGVAYLTAARASVADVPQAELSPVDSNVDDLWRAALQDFAATQFRELILQAAITTVFSAFDSYLAAAFNAGIAGSVASAWNNVIGPAIAAAAVIAYTTWVQVENASVPIKLERSLACARNTGDCEEDLRAGTLGDYASTTIGRRLILEAFLKTTMPDFVMTRLEHASLGQAADHGPASPSDPAFAVGDPASIHSSMMTQSWNGEFAFTSIRDGWFVQSRANGPHRYTSSVDFVAGPPPQCDESGCVVSSLDQEHWTAWLHAGDLLAQRIGVVAGPGRVTTAVNLCAPNAPLLPSGNLTLGDICVLPEWEAFDFPIQAGDRVVVGGQTRTVRGVTLDGSNRVTSFSTHEPFGSRPTNVPVIVLTRPGTDCLTTSSLGGRVAGPDCVVGTLPTTSGSVRLWTRPTLTITAPSLTVDYGGAAPDITPTFAGFVDGDSVATMVTPPTCGTPYVQGAFPGSYGTACSGAVDPKYHIVYVAGTLNVPFEPMTITAPTATITYGDAVPVLSPSYAGGPEGLLVVLPTCTTTYTPGAPAGVYPTSCSGAVAPIAPIVCEGTLGGPLTCSGGGPRFVIEYASGAITVAPAPLTVTASSATVTYGDEAPVVTPGYSGFVNGESVTALTAPAVCSTTYVQGAGVGHYPATCAGASSPNYAIGYVSGLVSISARPLFVVANDRTKTYGDEVAFAGSEFTATGLYGVDAVTRVMLSSAGSDVRARVATSPYPIVVSDAEGSGLGNYSVSYVEGSLTVLPAALTVTASSDRMTVGDTVPAITPTYGGFVAGDTPGDLDAEASCSTVATSASPAGAYATECVGVVTSDYAVAYIDGALTVSYALSVAVDPAVARPEGAALPIRVTLLDTLGVNRGGPGVTVALASPAVLPAPGAAPQPEGTFILTGPAYLYVLRTTGFPSGTYTLAFIVSGDPAVHEVPFVVR